MSAAQSPKPLSKAALRQETRRNLAAYDAQASKAAGMPLVPGSVPAEPPIDINQEIAREQQLKNQNVAQDIKLKRTTLNRLFAFLTAETALIFLFAIFQATSWPGGFHLDDWSFRVVVGATIAQITGMLFVAVRYLFPSK